MVSMLEKEPALHLENNNISKVLQLSATAKCYLLMQVISCSDIDRQSIPMATDF